MSVSEEWVELGRINGVFGVKGWVKVFSYTRPREEILNYNPWFLKLNGEWSLNQVVDGKIQGDNVIALLEGCSDRDRASMLKDIAIAVRAEQLPETEEGEYYWRELIGLEVETTTGQSLGKVEDVMETGANDVLILSDNLLIPFTRDAVLSVDKDARKMLVDWDSDF